MTKYSRLISIVLSLALLSMALGCSARTGLRESAGTAPSPPAPAAATLQSAFAPPSTLLRTASAVGDETRNGAQFDPALPYHRVIPVGNDLSFVPDLPPGSASDLSRFAYATYSYDLSTYAGPPRVQLDWSPEPAAGHWWLAAANFDTDRWDWFAGPLGNLAFDSLDPYTAPDGTVLIAVAVGDTQAPLESIGFTSGIDPIAQLSITNGAGDAPLTVELDASASSDSDGSIVKYEWDLNGNGSFDATTDLQSVYAPDINVKRGIHTLAVRVTDDDGLIGTATALVNITGYDFVNPIAEIFTEMGNGGDSDETKWLKSVYATLPVWHDDNRAFQTLYFMDLAEQVVALTNAERAAEGLAPLTLDPHLELLAQAHARDLAIEHFIENPSDPPDTDWNPHINLYLMDPFDRYDAIDGAPYYFAAENLAAGQVSPAAVVAAWMASPPHRANIMIPELRSIGVGLYFQDPDTGTPSGNPYRYYWVQFFTQFQGDPDQHDWLEPGEVN